ncbi:hypothetical protein ACN38_g9232 [Penicillium nordicum]|uniref:Secreted protein n=1 Tax=Penicillium nordicum TaxID=229535 RepID=A0A0M9WD19_9EURO|nr:hypothetical protein ACN38_g9232 [Penicillium nordicum]
MVPRVSLDLFSRLTLCLVFISHQRSRAPFINCWVRHPTLEYIVNSSYLPTANPLFQSRGISRLASPTLLPA